MRVFQKLSSIKRKNGKMEQKDSEHHADIKQYGVLLSPSNEKLDEIRMEYGEEREVSSFRFSSSGWTWIYS
jgi:hypothetical protein